MGLDMYAYRTKALLPADVDFEEPDTCERIAYWRKHHDLHAWMRDLYDAKGGGGYFNCVPVTLDLEDLDQLEALVMADKLPSEPDCLCGDPDPHHKQDTLVFIDKARASIQDGYSVYYTSWW